MIRLSLKEGVQTTLLLRFLVLKVLDGWVLSFNLLRYLGDFVIFARSVLIKISLVLSHVAVAHVFVLLNKFVLEVLVESIKHSRECLNSSWSVAHWYRGRDFGNFAEFSHFRPTRKITHLCWLYYEHVTLTWLTLSEFSEVAFNILTHYVMVFTNGSRRRRWVLRLLRLLTDGFIVVSLLVELVVIMRGKLGCYTNACNIFSVRWSNTLNGVLN